MEMSGSMPGEGSEVTNTILAEEPPSCGGGGGVPQIVEVPMEHEVRVPVQIQTVQRPVHVPQIIDKYVDVQVPQPGHVKVPVAVPVEVVVERRVERMVEVPKFVDVAQVEVQVEQIEHDRRDVPAASMDELKEKTRRAARKKIEDAQEWHAVEAAAMYERLLENLDSKHDMVMKKLEEHDLVHADLYAQLKKTNDRVDGEISSVKKLVQNQSNAELQRRVAKAEEDRTTLVLQMLDLQEQLQTQETKLAAVEENQQGQKLKVEAVAKTQKAQQQIVDHHEKDLENTHWFCTEMSKDRDVLVRWTKENRAVLNSQGDAINRLFDKEANKK